MDGFEYGQSFKWLLWYLLLEYGFMATLQEPGFLDFDNLPDTNFTCVGKVIGGYYADLETSCQMFHVCTIGQLEEPMDIRFLCLNGTVFDQETRVCERIDEVDCSKSEQFYSLNLELYGNTQAPIQEQSDETMVQHDHQSTTATSSTAKTTRQSFIITTAKPTKTSDLYKPHTVHKTSIPTTTTTTTISYQIPLNRPPDIRFNPHEINVSLNVRGTTDRVRSSNDDDFHRHRYGGDNKRTASSTTERIEHFKLSDIARNKQPMVRLSTTEDGEDIEQPFVDYQKEPLVRNNYRYRLNVPSANFRPSAASLLRHQQLQTRNHRYSHVNRPSVFFSPPKNQHYSSFNHKNRRQPYYTHNPAGVKLALDIPTRQPLTFSSPAPFSLPTQMIVHHRQFSPRIVISASASVSDASGRKFNYSLGTIGDSQLFGHAPQSYDDYREEDVGFDPFYRDVLKVRRRRAAQHGTTDAIDTLRFLFDWYSRHKSAGDEEISSKWNNTYGDVSTEDARKRQDGEVIYESVVEAIQQDPIKIMRNYGEYTDVYPFVEQNYELKRKSRPFEQNTVETNESKQNRVDSKETTAKYEQVLSILGITALKRDQDGGQSEVATEKSTAEDVLELPDSLIASQTEPATISATETDETPTESVEFGAKISVEYATEQSDILEDSIEQIPIVKVIATKNDVKDDDVNIESVYTSTKIVDVSPTIFATTTNSLFTRLDHRFGRFRSNTRSKHFSENATQAALTEINRLNLGKSYALLENSATVKPARKQYSFNCFGKDLNRFYSDPRDCRLFHYCTSGFTSTQLLDMKFVCDFGTFFDQVKLVCTKDRPLRCI